MLLATPTSRRLLMFGFVLVGLYMVTNILYVISYNTQSSAGTSISASIKQIQPKGDGTVDLVLNLNINQLLAAVTSDQDKPDIDANPLPGNFSFVLNNPNLCKGIPDLDWIIYVHSNPGAADKRRLLRETWGNKELFKHNVTRIVFLTATTSDPIQQQALKEEYDHYGDIIQADFEEGYKNLTLKAIMGLKWVSTYCSNAKFALKTDDDAFVNVFAIRNIIHTYYYDMKRTITCALWKENSMPILRDPSKCMKWCVKPHEFKGRKYFPQYCAGIAFLLSRELIPDMYQAALKTPFFWIDDVYITGLLPPKIKKVHFVDLLRNFTLVEKKVLEEYTNYSLPVTTLLSHVRKSENYLKVWDATLHRLTVNEIKQLGDSVVKKYPFLLKKLNGIS